MNQPKAINTEYAGCLFRSRLEAKWAVFFDSADVAWQYESEGYELPSGRRYLPDFWLPEHEAFIEVKGRKGGGLHLDPKWRELHDTLLDAYNPIALDRTRRSWGGDTMPKRAFIVSDIPRYKGTRHTPATEYESAHDVDFDVALTGMMMGPGSPHAGWTFGACMTCGDFQIGHVAAESPLGCRHEATVNPMIPRVENALKAARSKRFEHDDRSTW